MSTVITFLFPALIVLMLATPLLPLYKKITTGKRARFAMLANIAAFFGVCALAVVLPIGDLVSFAAEAGETTAAAASSTGNGLAYIGAALAAGLSALGAGIAVASAAPAAIGATSEDPKSFGKSLIFVALGEGVALYGLLIAILIINNL
ncbi:MAG: ATP synthase subunit C [Oscillospiraceae bacterium]